MLSLAGQNRRGLEEEKEPSSAVRDVVRDRLGGVPLSSRGLEQLLVDREGLVRDDRVSELGENDFTSARPETRAKCIIPNHAPERRGEGVDVTRRNEQRVYLVARDLTAPGDVGCHDHASRRRGLEERFWQTLAVRRKAGDVRLAMHAVHVVAPSGVLDDALPHPSEDLLAGGRRRVSRIGLSHENEARICTLAPKDARGFDELDEPLVLQEPRGQDDDLRARRFRRRRKPRRVHPAPLTMTTRRSGTSFHFTHAARSSSF